MINQFLKAGGVTNVNDFYRKFPTEEHFNHYMKYGGINAYADGGAPRRQDYMDNEEQYQADMDAFMQGSQQPSLETPTVVSAKTKSNPYGGVSIVDFLASQNKAIDKGSRKKLAETLGIKNYTGLSGQNKALLAAVVNNPQLLENYPSYTSSKGAVKGVLKGSGSKKDSKKNSNNEYTDEDYKKAYEAEDFNGDHGYYLFPSSKKSDNKYAYKINQTMNNPYLTLGKDPYLWEYSNKSILTQPTEPVYTEWPSNYYPPNVEFPDLTAVKEYNAAQAQNTPLQAQSNRNGLGTALAVGAGLGTAGLGYGAYKKLPGMIASVKDINESVIDKKAVREAAMKQKALLLDRLSNIRRIREEKAAAEAAEIAKNAIGLGTRFKNALGIFSKSKYIEPVVEGIKAAFETSPVKRYGGEQYAYGGAYANVPQHSNPGMYADGYSGTSSGGQYFDDGGSFIPQYGDSAYGQLPKFGYGKAMYGMGMAYGGMYQEGGMPLDQEAMMAQQQEQQMPPQGQPDPQQLMQEIAQMLQQGAQPEQIMQQLVQMGIPEEQAQQMIQQVMQQMQGGQGQPQGPQEEQMEGPQGQNPQEEMMEEQGPPMGRFGRQLKMGGNSNSYSVGDEYDMSQSQIQDLIKKGYKIQYV